MTSEAPFLSCPLAPSGHIRWGLRARSGPAGSHFGPSYDPWGPLALRHVVSMTVMRLVGPQTSACCCVTFVRIFIVKSVETNPLGPRGSASAVVQSVLTAYPSLARWGRVSWWAGWRLSQDAAADSPPPGVFLPPLLLCAAPQDFLLIIGEQQFQSNPPHWY